MRFLITVFFKDIYNFLIHMNIIIKLQIQENLDLFNIV